MELSEVFLDRTTRQCINGVIELLAQENRAECEARGLPQEYERLFHRIEKVLDDPLGKSLLKQYEAMLEEEILFFDPYETYQAGKNLKLDGETDKKEAYQWYASKLRNSEEYQTINKERNQVFGRIIDQLIINELQDDMYRLNRLHTILYAVNKRKLHLFFELGFECCFTYPEDIRLKDDF